MPEKIYTLSEMRRLNRAAGGKYFHKSHATADRLEGVRTVKKGNVVTKVRPDGSSYSHRFEPETGAMRPVKADNE